MKKTARIIVFPGSNCDTDCERALHKIGFLTERVWHKDGTLHPCDLVVIPGGFSFGDYLRAGAIAKASPIMKDVVRLAKKGVPTLGICNGFQILLEIGLLPGAMTKNMNLRFVCRDQYICTQTRTAFTTEAPQVLKIPIAHGEGNYRIDEAGLKALRINDQIVFEYCDENGNRTIDANPNGSLHDIAGVCSKSRTILGMMPHPERACDLRLGSEDGMGIFNAIFSR